jgi:hypothetical protein
MTGCNMQLLERHPKPAAKVSVILLDWGVRESFHSVRYLNEQSVPRDQYELIWIEFYDRVPKALRRLVDGTAASALDTWLVLGYPNNTHYHKHRMYNAGIVLAQGQICVFCDSDAIFLPTFIESIIKGFEQRPNAAIHLDEVRNYSKRYYPFNYPPIADILDDGCVNWTGTTTTGLDNSPDMLHTANYGACMAACRQDLLRIGGADEHIDYLGYICGPYELTFRLVNLGREEYWLTNEYIYHMWHPNTSGCNIEYKGPDDGRGMSLPAIQSRADGRVEPLKENLAIQRLRAGGNADADSLLALLVQEDDGAWTVQDDADEAARRTSSEVHLGFSVTCYRNTWYAVPSEEGPFDPIKVQNQQYTQCYSAATRAALHMQLSARQVTLGRTLLDVLRRLPVPRRFRRYGKWLIGLNRGRMHQPSDFSSKGSFPYLVEEGYRGFNIVCCGGFWYGLGQEEGGFDAKKLQRGDYGRCIVGESLEAVRAQIRVQQRLYKRAMRFARRCLRGAPA